MPATTAVLFERTTEEIQFPCETFLVADGSSSTYHRRVLGMLVIRVVVSFRVQIQVGVSGFSAHTVSQGAIWSSAYVTI